MDYTTMLIILGVAVVAIAVAAIWYLGEEDEDGPDYFEGDWIDSDIDHREESDALFHNKEK